MSPVLLRRGIALAVLAIPTFGSVGTGQAKPRVGDQVRVQLAPTREWRTGSVRRLTADTVELLQADGALLAVSSAQIQRAEVRTIRTRATTGAMVGGLGLGGAVVVFGLAWASNDQFDVSDATIAAAAIGGVAGGAAIGALIGSGIRAERWVEWPRPWSLALRPSQGGATLVLRYRF